MRKMFVRQFKHASEETDTEEPTDETETQTAQTMAITSRWHSTDYKKF